MAQNTKLSRLKILVILAEKQHYRHNTWRDKRSDDIHHYEVSKPDRGLINKKQYA